MLKNIVFATALVITGASPAFASSCPKHMKAIDEALSKNPSVSAQQMAEVKKLRADGESLHGSGKHAESMAALGKAEKVLGISK